KRRRQRKPSMSLSPRDDVAVTFRVLLSLLPSIFGLSPAANRVRAELVVVLELRYGDRRQSEHLPAHSHLLNRSGLQQLANLVIDLVQIVGVGHLPVTQADQRVLDNGDVVNFGKPE